jgi:hypothetical protein
MGYVSVWCVASQLTELGVWSEQRLEVAPSGPPTAPGSGAHQRGRVNLTAFCPGKMIDAGWFPVGLALGDAAEVDGDPSDDSDLPFHLADARLDVHLLLC